MAEHGVMVDRADTARKPSPRRWRRWLPRWAVRRPTTRRLLDEVTDLVEQPTALRGNFEQEYLRLPKEVLITVMKKHQRYFPVVRDGKMLPHFITVRNGPAESSTCVREGNEGVIRARYADAAYFFRADTAKPLEAFTPRLATLTFQEKLGLDARQSAPGGAARRAAGDAVRARTQRSRRSRSARPALFKSDLATQMVVELTSLQGIMGREYAKMAGEPDAVANAIYEHYLPRFQGDAPPASKPGLLLGIANRLDSLVGLFAVGLAPTSTADPFGLRRDALGLVGALVGRKQSFGLQVALQTVAAEMPVPVAPQVLTDVLGFIRDRLAVWLRDQGLAHDVVAAVLAERSYDPYLAATAARDSRPSRSRPAGTTCSPRTRAASAS